jgi:hypothetical protein
MVPWKLRDQPFNWEMIREIRGMFDIEVDWAKKPVPMIIMV